MALRFKAMPDPLPGMRSWCADAGDHHFVITHEDGSTLQSDADRKEWVGYTATFKSSHGRNQQATRVAGIWQSFAEAEAACKQTLRLLKMKH